MIDTNIVKKSIFSYGEEPLSRLDPEFCSILLSEEEEHLKKFDGFKLSQLIDKYGGPTVNKDLFREEELVKYIAIDSVDLEDGFSYNHQFLTRIDQVEPNIY